MVDSRGAADLVLDQSPGDDIPAFSMMAEQGLSGLKRVSGYVEEEFLGQLKGRRGVSIFREMSDNSSVIGGWGAAVMQLLRQIEYRVEPASDRPEDRANAEFVEQNQNDMSHSWGDMITEIASFIYYGWEWSEICYKRRQGPWYTSERDNNLHRSKYDDQRIGWSKIAGRAQETMLRWVFDDNGGIRAMVQMAAPRYERRTLDLRKAMLFRTTTSKNNPEGRSLLRNAYLSWWFLKRFQEIEAIGVERDLTGLPIAKVPARLFNAEPGTADAKMFNALKALIRGVRRNERDGIIWPWETQDDKGTPVYDFQLLTSGGTRQFDIGGIIDRLKTEILMSVLADFMMVGHEDNGGSYALHTDKSGIFRTAINALAQQIADQFNRKAIPQLFEVNGERPRELPQLVPNDVDAPNLTELGSFLQALSGCGLPLFPNPQLEAFLFDAARLPKLDPMVEEVHGMEMRQQALMGLAQQRFEALQMEQQAAQGQLALAGQTTEVTGQQQAIEAGPQGQPTDPNDAKRSDIAVQSDQVKLKQEGQKLSNLKTQGRQLARRPAPGRSASKSKPSGKRAAVKKSSSGLVSGFGIDHDYAGR